MPRATVPPASMSLLATPGLYRSPNSGKTSNLPPEAELLICCARTRMNSEWADRVKALLQGDIDWTSLYRMAFLHGMRPLLYWHLNATCPDAVPKATMDYLREYFHANAAHNLYLTGELCSLLKLLDANRIPAIPFGGPVLAASLYGNLTLRQFSDLDILVRKRDVTKAGELLVSQGYRPRFNLGRAKETAFLQYHSEYLFLHSKDRFVADSQLRILSLRLDAERVWERLEPLALGGHKVLTLSPEDLLLILCVHGIKHLWEGLPWISDVAMLVGLREGLDWERLLERASTLGSRRMLFLGLYLAGDLLGAALPEEVLQRVQSDPVAPSLAAQVRKRLILETDGPPGVLENSLFHLKATERLRDRIRHCLLAMTPNHGDWESLSSSLTLLYSLLRPIRSFKKYGWDLFQYPVLDLAPYVKTPMEVIERMLVLADVGPTDVVYDFGCGDGRIVIAAAKRYGARGVGIDIDSRRIADAKANARKEDVERLVTFIQQDAKTVEPLEATVVMLFLSWPGNLKLRQTLQEQLRPGARLVSRNFDMADWPPEKTEILVDTSGAINTLYLWRIANAPTQTSCATKTSTSLWPIFLTQQDE